MCGRITQQLTSDEIARLFGAQDEALDLGGHYNVAPTQDVRVVVEDQDRRVVSAMRWGLIPAWAADPSIGSRMINARAETVDEKPSFRTALRRYRCIVPANSFYEWKRDGATKVPYVIARRDGAPLALAGLWSVWRPKDSDLGKAVRSFTIITTQANAVVAPLHDRMPVVLPEEVWDEWVDPANDNVPALKSLLVPYPPDAMRAYPVSSRVNNARNDGPDLLEAVAVAS